MLVSTGITLVDQLMTTDKIPASGEKTSATTITATPGGGAASTSVIAASLGSKVRFFTCLGGDEYGVELEAAYRGLGIELEVMPCDRTPVSLVMIEPDGERTLITMRGGVEPQAEAFEAGIFAAEDDLFLPQTGMSSRASFLDRVHGKKVLPGRHLRDELEIGRQWEIVVASSDEICKPEHSALKSIGCELFVLTDGAAGGDWWYQGHWHHFATPDVKPEEIADACGAGDSFLGGLLAGLDQGLDPAEAIELGAEQGAACLRRRGAWPMDIGLMPLLP